ncbi:acetoacetate decarboxylase family protein [Halocatena marina]|uniref:Acetoacetate decarboxylase family protein n=1 Tax=Halocatena marina TaxID=2934937 RepID=A0ABD5YSW4_9EURY
MGLADDGKESVEEQVTLSTGQTVTLPLSTDVTMMSVVFSAALDPVRALLPSCLSPVRVGRKRAAVTFLFVRYHSVDDGSLEPYDEFGVLIPATRPSSRATPILSRLLVVWVATSTRCRSRPNRHGHLVTRCGDIRRLLATLS